MSVSAQHLVAALLSEEELSKFEVSLPPEIDPEDLEHFLEEYFPYRFMVTEEGGKHYVYTPSPEGGAVLHQLLPHYWSIDPHAPRKFFRGSRARAVIDQSAKEPADGYTAYTSDLLRPVEDPYDLLKPVGESDLDNLASIAL